MKRRFLALVSLVRPPFAILLLLFAQLGAAHSGAATDGRNMLAMICALAGWLFAVVALNELGDEDVDRANLARQGARPLVNGDLSRLEMWTVAGFGAGVSLLSSAMLGPLPLVVIAVGLVLGGAYSLPPIQLSRRGAVTSLLLPLGYVAVPFLLGGLSHSPTSADGPRAATSAFSGTSLLLLGGLYIGFLGRLVLKDFRDLDGDLLYGKRTFLVRYGRVRTCSVSAVLWILGGVPLMIAIDSLTVSIAYAASAVATLWLLNRLATSPDEGFDDIAIASIATLGRTMLLTIVAYCSARQAGSPTWAGQAFVVAGTSLGFMSWFNYWTHLERAGSVRLDREQRRDHVLYPHRFITD